MRELHTSTLVPDFPRERGPLLFKPRRGPFQDLCVTSIRTEWGEPDLVHDRSGTTYWHYKHQLEFAGLVLGAVLPVPLVVPIGHRETVFAISGDRVVQIEETYGAVSFACGIVFAPASEAACGEMDRLIW